MAVTSEVSIHISGNQEGVIKIVTLICEAFELERADVDEHDDGVYEVTFIGMPRHVRRLETWVTEGGMQKVH